MGGSSPGACQGGLGSQGAGDELCELELEIAPRLREGGPRLAQRRLERAALLLLRRQPSVKQLLLRALALEPPRQRAHLPRALLVHAGCAPAHRLELHLERRLALLRHATSEPAATDRRRCGHHRARRRRREGGAAASGAGGAQAARRGGRGL